MLLALPAPVSRRLRVVSPLALPLLAGLAAGLLSGVQRGRRRQAERLAAATFEVLLNAIDANDAETGLHVRRVARYALVLADAVGLPEHLLREVELVALFHDVGKIHEALFDIVHDDARLSEADREAIATHPRRGSEVLEPLSPFHPGLAEGVLAHHERWDGTGYPRRLAGRAIPITARIVAIADSFDAVTHRRRYQEGRSLDEGFEVVRRGAGTHFDPELVARFLEDDVRERVRRAHERALRPRGPASRRDRRVPADPLPAPRVKFRWRESGLAPATRGGRPSSSVEFPGTRGR